MALTRKIATKAVINEMNEGDYAAITKFFCYSQDFGNGIIDQGFTEADDGKRTTIDFPGAVHTSAQGIDDFRAYRRNLHRRHRYVAGIHPRRRQVSGH